MEFWLPLFFMGIMGLALLIYVILDGYDLGIGLLLPLGDEEEKELMIAAIGPFWDANETWLVLGIGVLLVAFPLAHGAVLTALYVPVTLMLFGLILRGISFDFRVKGRDVHKARWNRNFFLGSLLASACQGWMLGAYVTGLTYTPLSLLFSALIALTLPALYVMLGAAWLLVKAEGRLFEKARCWACRAILPMGLGLLLLSIATPLVSREIAAKWFDLPNAIALAPIPLVTAALFLGLLWLLHTKRPILDHAHWLPFTGLILICLLAAVGLAYSIFPEIIIGRMLIWDAAASTDSLLFTFVGTVITLPAIIGYTIFVYRVFRGKASKLSYE